jgi:hypothetical protein
MVAVTPEAVITVSIDPIGNGKVALAGIVTDVDEDVR